MIIKELRAKAIKDTRGDKTIGVFLKTDFGEFKASAPNGKSKGEHEATPWKKNINEDIKIINSYPLYQIEIESFDDLTLLEDIFIKQIGANSMIAIEYVFLKALAKKQNKEVWQLINPRAEKMPMPVGNAIGGGAHSSGKKPDFQEFHFIPITSNFEKAVKINKRALENCKEILKNVDKNFKAKKNDENAWQTSLTNNQILEVMQSVRDNMIDEFKEKMHLGVDVAASTFFSRKKYNYKHEKKKIDSKKQVELINNLAKIIYYIEDPLEENDFSGFAKLNSKGLIVGDDLTVTNLDRIIFAFNKKSINAVIIKPNQNGSLIEVKKIAEFCRKNKIKMIFSHRSGETDENILADLGFGFQAEFIKTGISGKGRDEKLERLIEIERNLV